MSTLPDQVPSPDATPAATDLIYKVDDPYGTPADDATTIGDAVTKGHGLSDGAVVGVVAGVLDSSAVTASAAELNKLDGVTADTTELNILDGVTADASEINKLDGLLPTTAELNYVDGVTSAIQGQIDGKQATDTDLTDISALTPTNDDIMQRKGGAWTNRTVAQVKSDLALNNVTNVAQLPASYLDTDTALAGNSDVKVASQKATKAYVDTAVTGLLEFKGSTDASASPNYPAASKGDAYVVSVAGKVGGASGKSVDVSDVYLAIADNAGGTEAGVGTSWNVLEHNLVGALLAANNLSDVANAATAKSNLGLSNVTNNAQYYAGGTDVAVADGGTGASTKAAGFDALSPMTASGDIVYGGASGTGTALVKGTDGYVLTLASGLPSWAASAGGGSATGDDWLYSHHEWSAVNNTTTANTMSFPATATANATNSVTWTPAEPGYFTANSYETSTSTGQSAQLRMTANEFQRGHSAYNTVAGGFQMYARVMFNTTASGWRFFVGMTSGEANIGNVDPSSLVDMFGFAADTGDTNMQIMSNDASGTATKTTLGTDFPRSTGGGATNHYECWFTCTPNGNIAYTVKKYIDDNTIKTATGTITSDLPTQNQGMAPHIWMNNAAAAATIRLRVNRIWVNSRLG